MRLYGTFQIKGNDLIRFAVDEVDGGSSERAPASLSSSAPKDERYRFRVKLT